MTSLGHQQCRQPECRDKNVGFYKLLTVHLAASREEKPRGTTAVCTFSARHTARTKAPGAGKGAQKWLRPEHVVPCGTRGERGHAEPPCRASLSAQPKGSPVARGGTHVRKASWGSDTNTVAGSCLTCHTG